MSGGFGFNLPYPTIHGYKPTLAWKPFPVWITVNLNDYYTYQKIWVPEPPCYDVFPSVFGIDIKNEVSIRNFLPLGMPAPAFYTSDRAEYHSGYTTNPVP